MIIHLVWISFIITFIIYLIKQYKEYDSLEIADYFLAIMISLLIGVIVFTFVLISAIIVDHNTNKQLIQSDIKTIYALNDDTSIKGQSFLFSGYIDEKLIYRMFINEDGGKQVKEVNASKTTIYEQDETLDSRIETYKYIYTNNAVKWLYGDSAWDDNIYKIYIPKGSITTEYKINLQ